MSNNIYDELVVRIGNSGMQRKMLQKNLLTLEEAIDIAQSDEVTDKTSPRTPSFSGIPQVITPHG